MLLSQCHLSGRLVDRIHELQQHTFKVRVLPRLLEALNFCPPFESVVAGRRAVDDFGLLPSWCGRAFGFLKGFQQSLASKVLVAHVQALLQHGDGIRRGSLLDQ